MDQECNLSIRFSHSTNIRTLARSEGYSRNNISSLRSSRYNIIQQYTFRNFHQDHPRLHLAQIRINQGIPDVCPGCGTSPHNNATFLSLKNRRKRYSPLQPSCLTQPIGTHCTRIHSHYHRTPALSCKKRAPYRKPM